jgi:hypothetical protein
LSNDDDDDEDERNDGAGPLLLLLLTVEDRSLDDALPMGMTMLDRWLAMILQIPNQLFFSALKTRFSASIRNST